jgi:hypothetical protein
MRDPIEHRVREARLVIELLRNERDALSTQLTDFARDVLRTKKLPAELAFGPVVDVLADMLEHAVEDLERTSRELASEQADDADPRDRRDRYTDAVLGFMTRFREQVRGVGGDLAVRRLGIVGNTPREPGAVRKLARTVFENLPSLKLPKQSKDGSSLDVKRATEGALENLKRLDEALKDVAREQREEQVKREARNVALARFDRTRNGVVWGADALFTLAGRDEIVERIRLAQAQSASEIDGAADGGGEEPADDGAKPAK